MPQGEKLFRNLSWVLPKVDEALPVNGGVGWGTSAGPSSRHAPGQNGPRPHLF